jgi:small-conductance mechanosensitive channel
MIEAARALEQLELTLSASVGKLIEHLPTLVAAALILLAGWLIARLIRSGTIRLIDLFNGLLEQGLPGQTQAVVHLPGSITRLIAGALYWITLFIFAVAALNTAGLTGFAAWLDSLVNFVPVIVTGGLVILVGYIFSVLVREVTLAAAHSARISEALVLSRLAQAITLVTAIVIGLELIGVDVTFLTTILGVSTAALLAGFALAFGLGARTLVSNLIAAHYLGTLVEPGQKIRIGDREGTVLELTATAIILDTADGRTSIPAKACQEQAVVVLVTDAAVGGEPG